jgi:outer membrane protein OmpA-like peptidoglycan-associated protein
MSNVSTRVRFIALTFALALSLSPAAFAQGGMSGGNSRTVASGQKMKLKGVVTSRQADTFVVQDANGVSTTVLLTNTTSVKTSGGFLRGGTNYGVTAILRGLNLEVEGRGDGTNLVAEKVRFKDTDLRTARTVEANVTPVENRVGEAEGRIGQVEQNAQRLSGQLDELAAVSNAARGGAKAAQETADAAVAGVNATNERISALDDYLTDTSTSVLFRVGSAVLSAEGKEKLDELVRQALQTRGYIFEVSGFASGEGGTEASRRLSQRRADAVIRYLVENHRIPLRRIVTPYGFGELNPVADNATRAGREQNRRVEVKMLVSRGLMAPTDAGEIEEFPWPPNASAVSTVARNYLVRHDETISLKTLGERLQFALGRAGYGQGGFYGVPGGFALASKMEQFKGEDGAPLMGNNRWIIDLIPPRLFSREYWEAISKGVSGNYRVVVFVVTDRSFTGSGEEVTSQRARTLVKGSNTLPEEPFNRMPYSNNYTCTALIYEFRQTDSDTPPKFQPSSVLQADTHLRKAGILKALEELLR